MLPEELEEHKRFLQYKEACDRPVHTASKYIKNNDVSAVRIGNGSMLSVAT